MPASFQFAQINELTVLNVVFHTVHEDEPSDENTSNILTKKLICLIIYF